ncbi:MAG: DNA polymerase III subunit delta, partial [Gammaproteobacteria bacterium]
AAAQEVEKLCLLVDADAIDARSVIAAVSDSARYDVYQLVDAALLGDSARALRVARGLREEGVEPVLVAWALGRELHQLAAIAAAAARGGGITRAMDEHRVWSNRKRMVGKMLERHGAQALLGLMAAANSLDTVVKGAQFGAPWDEIEILVLRMCGVAGAARLAGSYH